MTKQAEVEEILEPTTGKRRFYAGFYDRAATHGTITGSGPNFDKAMAAFNERQRQRGMTGKWRHKETTTYKKDNGTLIDSDFEIKEWL